MKQLRAFTLVELIVVMIISIITLATIYTVYLLIKKQYLRQSTKSESLNNYLQFKNILMADFQNADSVKSTAESQSVICYLDTMAIGYEFSEKAVIRRNRDFSDSFLLFPHNLVISTFENSELVKQVSLKIVPFKDTVFLEFTKQYDANCLIKIEHQ